MATTRTKKTTAAKAAPEKETMTEQPIVENTTTEVKETVKPEVKKKTVYSKDTMIPCRSVTCGELVCASKKNRNFLYTWSDYDDVCEVEYQDLVALRSMRSGFIFNPQFIILDDELVEEWGLNDLYSSFYGLDNPSEFFTKTADEMRAIVRSAPAGLKEAIKDHAAVRVKSGELDKMSIVKVIDEELNTDLKSLM